MTKKHYVLLTCFGGIILLIGLVGNFFCRDAPLEKVFITISKAYDQTAVGMSIEKGVYRIGNGMEHNNLHVRKDDVLILEACRITNSGRCGNNGKLVYATCLKKIADKYYLDKLSLQYNFLRGEILLSSVETSMLGSKEDADIAMCDILRHNDTTECKRMGFKVYKSKERIGFYRERSGAH